MAVVRNFRELKVWQKSMEMVTLTYHISRQFPASEHFGLTAQWRRSAVSVSSNIAEGFGRHAHLEFIRFLQIATGSWFEWQTQLTIAEKLSFLKKDEYKMALLLSEEIEKLMSALISKLKSKTTA